ncbi:uncharacterized protein LOC142173491 [Nicotiana tabacum]|uniref:Uncharacterized protein LOC142173491 n=1 Tax=Nicotiana tabacum TaxID=4097 RepID=A0AC58TDA4_TOBAC
MAKHHISSMVVKWNPPRNGFVKINSDGCSKGNPGPAGGGSIVRNDQGKIIISYAAPLGCMTNNMAEAMALKIGIEWCRNVGITELEIDYDSKLLVDWISNNNDPPWTLWDILNKIKYYLQDFDN